MDINKIIKDFDTSTSSSQETLTELFDKKSTSRMHALLTKTVDLQEDALIAVKRDPAVLDARVANVQSLSSLKSLQFTKANGLKPRKEPEAKPQLDFDSKVAMERAALLSLSSDQFSLLLRYVDTLRQQRLLAQKQIECGFCRNNRRSEVWYTTHALKDAKGRVICPILRSLACPRCGATGDRAHTVSHCPRWRYN